MPQYRKKPVVIEAVKLTNETFTDPHPNPEHIVGVVYDPTVRCAYIKTLEGTMRADVGDWISYVSTFKTCQGCRDIRQWVQNNVPCLCWAHGNTIEDCREAVQEAHYRAPEETRGLRFGFLRRLAMRDKRNQSRRIS